MDFLYADDFNHMLTRQCSCGGNGEMLVDFVDDFVVRCSKCHLSTHAYIRPEDAAQHWNAGDDIMAKPMHIFWDDPEGYLQGEVIAIHISDDEFKFITDDSIHFMEAVIEYTDKMLFVGYGEGYAIDIEKLSSYNPDGYRYRFCPQNGETIKFEKIVFSENKEIVRLEYRLDDIPLLIDAAENNLVFAQWFNHSFETRPITINRDKMMRLLLNRGMSTAEMQELVDPMRDMSQEEKEQYAAKIIQDMKDCQ